MELLAWFFNVLALAAIVGLVSAHLVEVPDIIDGFQTGALLALAVASRIHWMRM